MAETDGEAMVEQWYDLPNKYRLVKRQSYFAGGGPFYEEPRLQGWFHCNIFGALSRQLYGCKGEWREIPTEVSD